MIGDIDIFVLCAHIVINQNRFVTDSIERGEISINERTMDDDDQIPSLGLPMFLREKKFDKR